MPAPPGGKEINPPVTIPSTTDPVLPKEEKPVEQPEIKSVIPPPVKEEAKPLKVAAFGSRKLVSSFSLKKQVSESEEEEENVEDLSKKPRTPFTEEQLKGKWRSYCYQIEKEGKAGLAATLTKHPVIIKDDFKLELVLDNEIQETELNSTKANLLSFLRKELNNYAIDLISVMNKNIVETKHLTNKDKFMQMVEKNPVLGQLRERLDLDIEY
jgi:DNA polymerase-3 subunit gamma/tau